MEKGMDRVFTLMEKGSGMETSMKVNTRTGNFMVKEHTPHLMETSMLGMEGWDATWTWQRRMGRRQV